MATASFTFLYSKSMVSLCFSYLTYFHHRLTMIFYSSDIRSHPDSTTLMAKTSLLRQVVGIAPHPRHPRHRGWGPGVAVVFHSPLGFSHLIYPLVFFKHR